MIRERSLLRRGESGWIRLFSNPRDVYGLHTHSELECNVVRKGTGTYRIGSSVLDLGPGDCLWLHPEQPHQFIRTSPDIEVWILVLDPKQVRALARRLDRGQQLLAATRPVEEIARRLSLPSFNACNTMIEDVYGLKDLRAPVMRSALAWVFTRLWIAFLEAKPSRRNDLHPGVSRCLEILQQLETPFRRSDLAAAVGLSPTYLSRLFVDQLGISITDYRNEQRLRRAIEQMRTTSLDLLTIAMDSGFGSYPQFHRVFKAQLGCSPGRWMQAQGAGVLRL